RESGSVIVTTRSVRLVPYSIRTRVSRAHQIEPLYQAPGHTPRSTPATGGNGPVARPVKATCPPTSDATVSPTALIGTAVTSRYRMVSGDVFTQVVMKLVAPRWSTTTASARKNPRGRPSATASSTTGR